jgi:signal transduction histidine kinase
VLLAIEAGSGADGATLRAGVEQAIDELRELVDGVMPTLLTERGLAAAVRELAERLPAPIALRLDGLDGAAGRCPPPVESTAWFVVSEAIANAVKHARPEGLAVALARHDGALRIEVADAGGGGPVRRDGRGVRGMSDRVAALGGALTVEPVASGGTRVEAVIPCGS